jgi:hypothetical protein
LGKTNNGMSTNSVRAVQVMIIIIDLFNLHALEIFLYTKIMNRSPITAQNMNGYDFRIEEYF